MIAKLTKCISHSTINLHLTKIIRSQITVFIYKKMIIRKAIHFF